VFIGLLIIGLITLFVIWFTEADKDTQIYADSFLKSRASFPDKLVHLIVSYSLSYTFLHIQSTAATIFLVFILSVAHELVTHYPRKREPTKLTPAQALSTAWRDLVANGVGLIIAIIVYVWIQ
jgi:hypothetical protein